MSNVTTFKFNDLPVRIVEKDGKPLFVIRDVCNILGFSNPNRQLAVHTLSLHDALPISVNHHRGGPYRRVRNPFPEKSGGEKQ